jgi:hypothetical protein
MFGIGSLNSKDFCSLARSSFYLGRPSKIENLFKILYSIDSAGFTGAPYNVLVKTSQINHFFAQALTFSHQLLVPPASALSNPPLKLEL